MVCYAEKPFWFSSLGQIVQFGAIIFCRTLKNYFGLFVWIENKSHYNRRVSLHEAPTEKRKPTVCFEDLTSFSGSGSNELKLVFSCKSSNTNHDCVMKVSAMSNRCEIQCSVMFIKITEHCISHRLFIALTCIT